MGWFDEQVEYRKKHERELLEDSFENISEAITGHRTSSTIRNGADVRDAVSALLRYFGVREKETPARLTSLEDRLNYQLSASGILWREIRLTEGWHADAMGAMITSLKADQSVITILPSESGGFYYIDPHTGRRMKITRAEEKKISSDAWCFYRPLPMRRLKVRDLFRYMADCLTVWDYVSYGLAAFAVVLVGMLIPRLNHILIGDVVEYGSRQLLFAVVTFMLFATIGNLLFTVIRSLLLSRISIRLNVNVNAASMMRILSLPADFFKKYSSGELTQYIGYLNSLCSTIVNSVLSTGVTGIFSLVYLQQIFQYAPSLVLPSLIVTIVTLAISMITAAVQTKVSQEQMACAAKERGLVYMLLTGIQKIRLSGAENRAFVRWSERYAKTAELLYNPPTLVRISTVVTSAITMIGTAVMYYTAVRNQVSIADYYAFNAAYAYISAAFASLASVAMTAAVIRPSIELVKPLMEAEPEISDGRETITRLSGGIEFSHVTFGYDPDSRPLFEDLSFTIPAHQYVAIVGRSGCGKSTLMRLMLGFEKPSRGSIRYDQKDISSLDIRSLRRQIGTVLQDGKLFAGSVRDNILISAPNLKLEDAWEAAEIAGIADDIRSMPMGMYTCLQEGSGGISGGQRQRLMIARAVAPRPKILMFDEATSALDNITQKRVSEALDGMKCTRIIIAHRLSTIRHCDRILVLDGGKIIEDGTYEELIAQNGFFAELVERQRLDHKTSEED